MPPPAPSNTQNRMLAVAAVLAFPRSSSAHTNHRRERSRTLRSLARVALASLALARSPLEKEKIHRARERPPARESHEGKQKRTIHPPHSGRGRESKRPIPTKEEKEDRMSLRNASVPHSHLTFTGPNLFPWAELRGSRLVAASGRG